MSRIKGQPQLQLIRSPSSTFSGESEVTRGVFAEDKDALFEETKSSSHRKSKTPQFSKSSCCNCNSILKDVKKTDLHDFADFLIYHRSSRKVRIERVVVADVLRGLYDFEEYDLQSLNEDRLDTENSICISCLGSLRQLCQSYNQFISLSMTSNARLSRALESRIRINHLDKANRLKQSSKISVSLKRNREFNANVIDNDGKEASTTKFNSAIKIVTGVKTKREDISNDEQFEIPFEIFDDSAIDVRKSIDERVHPEEGKGEIQCDRCNRVFSSNGAFKVHKASHLREDMDFSCKNCEKVFKTKKAYEWHQQVDHNGHKPFQCSYEGCGKQFRLKKKLVLHIKVMHEKMKPHPCPKCEKSFRTKYDLKVHDVGKHVHGDDSIGCSKCRRKFPSRKELDKHVACHDEEKPHKCSLCSKGFQTLSRLKLHSKSHDETPSYICSDCGKTYKHKRDLLIHEVIHQDESTFRFGCGDCPRRFYRIDLLRNHQSNESHFSPETVGPSITKFRKRKERIEVKPEENQMTDAISAMHDTFTGKLMNTKEKKKKSTKSLKDDTDIACTEILTNPSTVDETDVNFTANTSDGLKLREFSQYPLTSNLFAEYGSPASTSKDQVPLSLSSLKGDVFAGNGSSSTLSLQPISILSLPSESSPVLSIAKEISDKNLHTFDISAGAEQIGIDVIHAFINNFN